ncbi:MAG: biotin transporter BioY [Clostridia bacterium]|nr:biotin transporter BioY [Clostridia bacterium]
MNNLRVKALIECSVFAAVIAVLSLISIPLPLGVPVTLQIFSVSLAGYFLGPKKGVAATSVYLAVGLMGLPVFAGFQGGFQVLLGPTGGFLAGFVLLAFFTGIASKFEKQIKAFLIGLIGLALCHILGTAQYSFYSLLSFYKAFLIVSAPYLIKDVLLLYLALFVSGKIKKKLI